MFSFKRYIETDDEFVCKIRKGIKIGRRLAILSMVAAFLLLAEGSWLLLKVFDLVKYSDREKGIIWAGFSVGIMLGIFFSILVAQTIYFLFETITGFKGKRKDKLLVKYYDALISHPEEKAGAKE
jgi:hypothetical protein